MKYPNNIQAALLFNTGVRGFENMVASAKRVLELQGMHFNIPEANPGKFYRFFGTHELMITFEYVENPVNPAVMQPALNSFITGMLCDDIHARVMRNKTHILINVSHGVMGSNAEILRLLATLDMPPEGATLQQFEQRLNILTLLVRIACDHQAPAALHWTQSDQIIPQEHFENYLVGDAPGPLHVHPYLFGPRSDAGERPRIGFRTFGARHFIGHEIIVEPGELPWNASYEVAFALIRVATAPNGYIIPDGDTFGPEDQSVSYRVIHRSADDDGVPLLELVPLLHREYGFVSPDYVSREERVFDDRMPPADLMPGDDDDKMELVNEWREKRAMAEGIGGRFEVRARADTPAPASPNPPPSAGGPPPGRRAVFGRKGL